MWIRSLSIRVCSALVIAIVFLGVTACMSDPGASSSNANTKSSKEDHLASSQSAVSNRPQSIAPNDPRLRYIGRVHMTAGAATYDWANIQIEFNVITQRIELRFDDGRNDYNVFIGGQLHSTISTEPGRGVYPIDVPLGEHHVRITKRTGPNFGRGQFLGLNLPEGGALLDLPAPPSRRIEFVGDSWTVGYGNEGPGLDCGGQYRPYENSFMSFAPIAARSMGAVSHSIAISGFGAVRNYGEATTTSPMPMPAHYDRTLMGQDTPKWNFQSWVPDAVVIKLGTNDHSTQPEPSASVFIQGVHGLIGQVHNAYGQLPVFLLADTSLPQVVLRMQTAVQEQAEMGNVQVHFAQITSPPQSQLGCDWHPMVVAHEAMAAELVEIMQPILGWRPSPPTPLFGALGNWLPNDVFPHYAFISNTVIGSFASEGVIGLLNQAQNRVSLSARVFSSNTVFVNHVGPRYSMDL